MEREETHVEQIREKDAHYSLLVKQLKSRINELEQKLDLMSKQRAMIVEGELSELKKQLAQCSKKENKGNIAILILI